MSLCHIIFLFSQTESSCNLITLAAGETRIVNTEPSYQTEAVIGSEHVEQPSDAVLEFTDNSVEAGAQVIRIILPPPQSKNNYLIVHDDGKGMNEQEIIDCLTIFRSKKDR